MTIHVGDNVVWHWTTTHPHTITSTGAAMEAFDSGTITGVGQTFSHTFTMEGSNPYECEIHAGMTGTITAEPIMGTEDQIITEFEFYPNPVTDILTINTRENIDRLEIYDMMGRLVFDAAQGTPTSKVYMQNYNAGTYLMKITSAGQTKTITIVKN